MTAEAPPIGELEATRPYRERMGPKGNLVYKLITTTDHKLIGIMYCVVCFSFFLLGGLMALLIRTELAMPGLQFLSNEQFNQLFTMHGTAMLLFYATPIVFGFANLVLPLQIGAPDVAFPRLNALSFWLFLFGALIALSGFITPGGAADFGWTAYTPLSNAIHSPGAGGDLWIGSDVGVYRLRRDCECSGERIDDEYDDPGVRKIVYALHVDGERLWLGAWNHGLDRYDPSRQAIERHRPRLPGRSSASTQIVRALLPDAQGLWLGSYGAGVIRADAIDGQGLRYSQPDALRPQRVGESLIWALARDDSGALWIGSDAGLRRWTAADGAHRIDVGDGHHIAGPDPAVAQTGGQPAGGVLHLGEGPGVRPHRRMHPEFGVGSLDQPAGEQITEGVRGPPTLVVVPLNKFGRNRSHAWIAPPQSERMLFSDHENANLIRASRRFRFPGAGPRYRSIVAPSTLSARGGSQ